MRTILFDNTVAFVSKAKMEDLAKIQKFNEKALQLVNEDKEVEFTYKTSGGSGGVSPMFIYFNEVSDGGYAMVKMPVVGENADEKKAFIAENYGSAISRAKKVEEKLDSALAAINEDLAKIKEEVTVAL